MFRTDLVMREVRRLADALARVLFLRKNGRAQEALEAIEQTGLVLGDRAGRSLSEIDYDVLEELLSSGGVLHVESAARLVELLVQAGEIYGEQDWFEERDDALDKALRLLISCFEEPGDTFPLQLGGHLEPLSRSAELRGLDVAMTRRLMTVFERAGRFGRAEDMLYALLGEGVQDVETIGTTFYERMGRITPTRLRKGNLPLKEVAEGRATFAELVRRQRGSSD